jgi:serine/threonine protein kinase
MAYLMPDGSPIDCPVISTGMNGILLRQGNLVLKIPKVKNTVSALEDSQEIIHANTANRMAAANEEAVYRRVWPHHGLVGHFECIMGGFLLDYLPRGNLSTFILTHPQPERSLLNSWILQLASTVLYLHNSKVLIFDLGARNVLIADDDTLKLIDFGQSTIFPETEDVATASDDGCTLQTDIFHFGCLIYTIVIWEEFEFDLPWDFVLPDQKEMPLLDRIYLETIIAKCWNGSYRRVEEIIDDLRQATSLDGV